MATWTTSGNTLYADPTSIDVAIGGTDSNASFWFDRGNRAMITIPSGRVKMH